MNLPANPVASLPFLSKSQIVQIGIVVPDLREALERWSAAFGLGVFQ